jgi:hypothetical protein
MIISENQNEVIQKGKVLVFVPYGDCSTCDLYIHRNKKLGTTDCRQVPCDVRMRKDNQYGNFICQEKIEETD